MQDPPDKLALLAAVARFLDKEVRPLVSDPRVSFRLLIAANLAQVVAAELRSEDAHDAAELSRLRALFSGIEPPPPVEDAAPGARRATIARLERELAERLRDVRLAGLSREAITAHVKDTLRDKLAVVNPRFDTRLDIP